jgi:hypothetical protein
LTTLGLEALLLLGTGATAATLTGHVVAAHETS